MSLTTNKPANWSILVAACCALLVAGLYLSSALGDVGNYMDWDKNKQYSTLLKAGGLALLAFLLATGVDVKALLGPLASFVPGTTTTVTETATKVSETKVTQDPVPPPPVPPVVPPAAPKD